MELALWRSHPGTTSESRDTSESPAESGLTVLSPDSSWAAPGWGQELPRALLGSLGSAKPLSELPELEQQEQLSWSLCG